MSEIIKSRQDLCTGCNRCVRECPMETANVTYMDEAGSIKVIIDHEKCIVCGRCISACKHKARAYTDDTVRFFADLKAGISISVIAAPAIRTNIPDYKRFFTYLKKLGVHKLYDVSIGADICIWAYIRHLERTNNAPLITQPCPAVVKYCEVYSHGLLPYLSPVHSPMSCVSVYMKQYEGVSGKIAALSPCAAKSHEFKETGLADYNVTFLNLVQYIKDNNIVLPEQESGFDHDESGIGSLFPMPGGLTENIEFFLGKQLSIDREEGLSVYHKLDTYAGCPKELLPNVFDVLNCHEGCNIGTACERDINTFAVSREMDKSREKATRNRSREYFRNLYKTYDEKLDLSLFMREYKPVLIDVPNITDEDINAAFRQLLKNEHDKQNIDCGACGSNTCHDMARKIALNVNIADNCITKRAEDVKAEHIENMLNRQQLDFLEKRHEADERIRTMLDANPHINILFSSKFEPIDCNPAAVSFMGFDSKEELLPQFMELTLKGIPEFQSNGRPSVPLTERFMTVVKEGAVKFDTDITLSGKMHSLNVDFKKIPYEDSFAIVAYIFDMTEAHDREMELTRTRELNEVQLAKIKMAVKATKIALWEVEIEGGDPIKSDNAFMWSDEFRRMLGYNNESDFPNLFGSWTDRVHPDDKDRILNGFADDLLNTECNSFEHEYWLKRKDGEYAYFKGAGEIIRGENGKAVHVAGTIMDITETKNILMDTERHRIEAEAANRAKSAFLSTMSHEIRTPMNAILGITEIQLQNEYLDQNTKEAFNKIYVSGDMLLGIINDILDLSKIEAGKLELVNANYETASLISDIAQLNMMRIGSKPIEFELSVDEELPVLLKGDELRVKQIFNNLLSNAFKYTDEGTVKLSVTSQDAGNSGEIKLVISVSDTGQGMTRAQIDKLFDEYSRFNLEANRSTEGTGLGMSITRNLIRLMNGDISIESEPGKGSVFTVRLVQGRVGSSVIGREMAESLHRFRSNSRAQMKRVQINREYMPYGSVLIVDDVETNIYVAKGLLAPYGLKIDSAGSGFDAIDKIKEGNEYDMVFMDHMMPKMDGIETTKRIRALGYGNPIVALTANAISGQADIFLSNGFDDFISKPIDVRQLNTVLNKLIRDKQPVEVIAQARDKAALMREKVNADIPKPDDAFIEIFIRDARRAVSTLEAIVNTKGTYSEGDIRSYVINVHGIKSALANIGKPDLSAVALRLEQTVRGGNTQIIAEETPDFLLSLRDFINEIKPKESGGDSGEDEDKELLSENLKAIKAAAEEYDEAAIEDILTQLNKKNRSHKTNELISSIKEHLLHSDFEEIVNAIEKNI